MVEIFIFDEVLNDAVRLADYLGKRLDVYAVGGKIPSPEFEKCREKAVGKQVGSGEGKCHQYAFIEKDKKMERAVGLCKPSDVESVLAFAKELIGESGG